MSNVARILFFLCLLSILALPGVVTADVDPTTPIWVFFTEDCRSAKPRPLTQESIERRAKADYTSHTQDTYPNDRVIAEVLATGATLRQRSAWLNAISVQATDLQRAEIERIEGVLRTRKVLVGKHQTPVVESKYEISDIDTFAYGVSFGQLDLIQVPSVHLSGYTGDGVRIAVFDGGFTGLYEHLSLQHLNIVDVQNFVSGGSFIETHDHGTGVVSTFAARDSLHYLGVAPEVEVLLAVTEDVDDEYPGEEDNFIAALEWAEAQGADLVTASIGYNDWYSAEDFDGDTAPATIACDMAAARGLLVITSVGNTGTGPLSTPADGDSVLAVGATNVDGEYANFSTQGPTWDGRIKPDVAAAGEQIWIADAATTDEYRLANGTSYSCPTVAGVAALLLEAADWLTPMDIVEALRMTASQAANPDNLLGWGVVNAEAALQYVITHVNDGAPERPYNHRLINIYPNPVNGQATLAITLNQAGIYELRVVNLLGRVVQSQEYQLVRGMNQLSFNLSENCSGQYYVVLRSGTKQLTSKLTVIR